MIAVTSKKAYKEINQEGTLKTQKDKIMYVIRSHYDIHRKGISNNEIAELTGFRINAVSGRVNDLKKDGVIETFNKVKCSITKRLVNTVVPKDNSYFREQLNKLRLLLGVYNYDNHTITQNSKNETTLRVGYWERIPKNDLVRLQVNSQLLLTPNSYYEEDCGDKFWYVIEPMIV